MRFVVCLFLIGKSKCNVSVGQLEALEKAGIAVVSVQNEFNIWTKTAASAFNGNPNGKTGLRDYGFVSCC